jgi:hypothetical protein
MADPVLESLRDALHKLEEYQQINVDQAGAPSKSSDQMKEQMDLLADALGEVVDAVYALAEARRS